MKMLRVEMFIPRDPVQPNRELRAKIIDEVGGLTESVAVGHWLDAASEIVSEGVNVFLYFVEDTDDNRLWVEEVAREYLEDADQECVLYVLDGVNAFFIDKE